jgi:hypothetical protein
MASNDNLPFLRRRRGWRIHRAVCDVRVDSLLDVKRKSCLGACDLLGNREGDVEGG